MRHIPVAALLDVGPGDELGTPDDEIAKCGDCGGLYRAGGSHTCTDRGWLPSGRRRV